ncbi:AAA family ATPase [Moorena producens]|uniref:AAA family ATPase n=1 Tax=Moorena producens TaxID=1155739 RepID=UPI003C747467
MTTATVRRNPYIVGSAISEPNYFFGRETLIEFVEDNLNQGERVILLHGQRRIGKSSVLLQIPNLVQSEQFVFIYFNLEDKGHLSLSNVLHLLAETITNHLINHLKLDLDYGKLPTEEDLASNPSIFSQNLLPEIYQGLGEKTIVLMLDEFDVLNNYDPTSSVQTFFPYLQSLLSQHEQLVIIPVIGRQPDDLTKLLSLFRRAPTYKIGLLSPEDTEKLITEPAKGSLVYSQDSIEAIIDLSAGHPYFTQLLCYALFVRARTEQKQQITPGDVEAVVDQAIELGAGGLGWFREGLPIPERVIFSAVAEAQKRADLTNDQFIEEPLVILKQYGVVETKSLIQAESQLLEWDFLDFAQGLNLLSDTADSYRVKVELVRRWLIKQHPLQREIWELEKLEPAAHSVYQSATDLQGYNLLKNAIPLYEQALSINPNYFKALFKLAEGYLETRDFSKAVELYKRAYQIDSNRVEEDYVQSLEGYGLDLMNQRKFELAKEQFAPILIIQPNNDLAQQKLQEIETYQEKFNFKGLDLRQFYKALNPVRQINLGDPEEQRYYIDFSAVRGNQFKSLLRTITLLSPDEPTCQLFTGHIGCGKTTELLRLKAELEAQGFHPVYFGSSQDIDLADVAVTDILLSISRHISANLEQAGINLKPGGVFNKIFAEVANFLQTPINIDFNSPISKSNFDINIAQNNPKLPSQLTEYLEPRLSSLIEAINIELIQPGIEELKRRGKEGLVVIVDNLDRVDNRLMFKGRNQQEHLFIDRAEQLKQLNCHVVYTMPLALTFSKEFEKLRNYFGTDPEVLPMVPVRLRDGRECHEGMALMRQMILARAFPNLPPEERLQAISAVFDSPATLDRLCAISGGHVRNLLRLVSTYIKRERELPLSRTCLERVIKDRVNELTLPISEQDWELLNQVAKQKNVRVKEEYPILLQSLFVFEYHYQGERWFDINPLLKEAEEFKATSRLNLGQRIFGKE